MEYSLGKKRTIDTHNNNMTEPQNHCAGGRKLDTKEYPRYESI